MMPNILLVDDAPNVTRALRNILRKERYNTLCAHSAQEALEILAQQSIDVLVTDEQMPGMTGSELVAKVYQEYPDTIRIILTGEASIEVAKRAINEGQIYRFLEKPCDGADLAVVIREALETRGSRAVGRPAQRETENQNSELAEEAGITVATETDDNTERGSCEPEQLFLDWTVYDMKEDRK